MIRHVKTPEPKPLPKPAEENRFEQIRKAAAERHKKSDTDGTRRRARQTAEDNRLI
jgi:hypothetical protein